MSLRAMLSAMIDPEVEEFARQAELHEEVIKPAIVRIRKYAADFTEEGSPEALFLKDFTHILEVEDCNSLGKLFPLEGIEHLHEQMYFNGLLTHVRMQLEQGSFGPAENEHEFRKHMRNLLSSKSFHSDLIRNKERAIEARVHTSVRSTLPPQTSSLSSGTVSALTSSSGASASSASSSSSSSGVGTSATSSTTSTSSTSTGGVFARSGTLSSASSTSPAPTTEGSVSLRSAP